MHMVLIEIEFQSKENILLFFFVEIDAKETTTPSELEKEFYTMQEHIFQTGFKRMEVLVAQKRPKKSIKKEDEVAVASSAYME